MVIILSSDTYMSYNVIVLSVWFIISFLSASAVPYPIFTSSVVVLSK